MAKNYMKEVANLLGVELEEEFKIKGSLYKHRITLNGMEYFHIQPNEWLLDGSYNFKNLITGDLIIEKPILNRKEKEYLSAVIKPFRNRVEYILKDDGFGKDFIVIVLDKEEVSLPYFEKSTMYKGMELEKEYTLEELGL